MADSGSRAGNVQMSLEHLSILDNKEATKDHQGKSKGFGSQCGMTLLVKDETIYSEIKR